MLTSLVDIFRKPGHCSMISHYSSFITRLSKDNGPASKANGHPIRRDALFQNFQKLKKSTSQADDIILDACMKFENYLIKTVGEDAFCSYCILCNYFKISKTRKKTDHKKKPKPGGRYHTIISKFQKFAKK